MAWSASTARKSKVLLRRRLLSRRAAAAVAAALPLGCPLCPLALALPQLLQGSIQYPRCIRRRCAAAIARRQLLAAAGARGGLPASQRRQLSAAAGVLPLAGCRRQWYAAA